MTLGQNVQFDHKILPINWFHERIRSLDAGIGTMNLAGPCVLPALLLVNANLGQAGCLRGQGTPTRADERPLGLKHL